jgi:hypothetical protein
LGIGVFNPDGFREGGVVYKRRIPQPKIEDNEPDQDVCTDPVRVGSDFCGVSALRRGNFEEMTLT